MIIRFFKQTIHFSRDHSSAMKGIHIDCKICFVMVNILFTMLACVFYSLHFMQRLTIFFSLKNEYH